MIIDRLNTIYTLKKKQEEIEQKIVQGDTYYHKYIRPTDKELTSEQKQEVLSFWNNYSFLYQVDLDTYKLYYNRTGDFNVQYVPNGFYRYFLRNHFHNPNYEKSFKDKNYVSRILSHLKHPETVCRRIDGYYFDGDYNRMTLEEVSKICFNYLEENGEFIVKPTMGGGGKDIEFIQKGISLKELSAFLKNFSKNFIIQQTVKQHPDISVMYGNAINTIRVTSMIYNEEVHILSSLLRMGSGSARVDNFTSGGVAAGINHDGTLKEVAFDNKGNKYFSHPSSNLPFLGFKVKNYDKVVETIKNTHIMLPMLGIISWDFAIDEVGDPVFIEYNMQGGSGTAQFTSGPFFGSFLESMLDTILQKHYIERANLKFDYREYHDHIEIEKYAGNSKVVRVPAELNDKPVTVIRAKAFHKNNKIKTVYLPDTIVKIGASAFSQCSSLESVPLPKSVQTIGKNAFFKCPLLKKNNPTKQKKVTQTSKDNLDKGSSKQNASTNNRHDPKVNLNHSSNKPSITFVKPHSDSHSGTKQQTESHNTSKTISLVAVGDNLLHLPIIKDSKQSDGSYYFDPCYDLIKDEIQGADISIINQETIFGENEQDYSDFPLFNSPKEIADTIVRTGFNVVLMANNHAMDLGEEGLNRTLEYWNQKYPDITKVGCNSSFNEQEEIKVIERNGIKLALLNYSYDVSKVAYHSPENSLPPKKSYLVNFLKDTEMMARQINKAKQIADVVIVFPHWGKEYAHEPWFAQKQLTNFFASHGVDIIIGSHPHVVQPVRFVERPDGGKMLVYYSLGNFFSCHKKLNISTLLGGMAKLKIEKRDDEIIISNINYEAVVTHYNSGGKDFKIYKLDKYSADLANENGIKKRAADFSLNSLKLIEDTIMKPIGTLRIEGDFQYIEYPNHVIISEYLGKSQVIEIPNKINSKDVTGIDNFAFYQNTTITKVIIPSSVTTIGKSAFASCTNLEQVVLPDALEKIDDNAFFKCSALTKINLHEAINLMELGIRIFGKCSALREISIPPKVTSIPTKMFISCISLTSFKFNSNILVIDECAFQNCKKLQQLHLPQKLSSIKSNAFLNCKKLENITIPESVTNISEDAFANVTSLEILCIPNSFAHQYATHKHINYTLEEIK